MPTISPGARQLPLRHLSIRVPWNDTGWTGVFCQHPRDNTSCLILPRIRDSRNDALEEKFAGHSWQDLDQENLPPCMGEHGQFMAPYPITRLLTHPYSKTSKAHAHYLPTQFRYPAYAAACIPFNWLLKESAYQHVNDLGLGLDETIEDAATDLMGFDTAWVQEKYNHHVLLDTFFSAIRKRDSLCLFYAKRIPHVEDARRILIGVGHVQEMNDLVEYRYDASKQGKLQALLWERAVQHTIRPGFHDGFLLPYHDVIRYLDEHPDTDPAPYVAFVPDDQFASFSYGTEHVTNDGAIAVLLAALRAIEQSEKIVGGQWEGVRRWIDERLNELWRMRGPCPGLGSALTAFGITQGTLVAFELERQLEEQGETANLDPWSLVNNLFTNPASFVPDLRAHISATLSQKWQALPQERRALLKLLSRFELSPEQATRFYVHEDKQRAKLHIQTSDAEILGNPYLLYELDRVAPDPIAQTVIDRGLFPDPAIRSQYPLAVPSQVDDATDARRVRSFVVRQLELAAVQGHTLQPREQIVQTIRELDVQPACPVDGDLMNVVESSFPPVLVLTKVSNNQPAYQLERLRRVGEVIRTSVQKRIMGTRHQGEIGWRDLLDKALGNKAKPDDQPEQQARAEKTAALEQIFGARLSVLVGPAGTGKTTLLQVLCHEPSVQRNGVLLLAPTGKARVRLEKQTGLTGAKTIAQFLLPHDRYVWQTGAYRLSDREKVDAGRTVVIDEASMLTEEQLASVLDALKGVERLILVGDPRQLPPIGAGRPFLDIVRQLTPMDVESKFPRVGPSYAELTIRRRQTGEARDDLLLAEWFSGRPLDPGADEIWDRVNEQKSSPNLRFVKWTTSDELQDKLLDVLVEELKLKDRKDIDGFERLLGGTSYENYGIFFWEGRNGSPGASAKAEEWQIMSPVRTNPHGVEGLNRLVQKTFRSKRKQDAEKKPWERKVPPPMGREEILYGDKVIQTRNQQRDKVYPTNNAQAYVANGEMGIVVGQYKTKKVTWIPKTLEVEFSSQPGYKYTYGGWDFGEEGNPSLELAYALTVHKTQGSEFGITFVILPNPCRLLSRELLYTALTRQQKRVVIFHQGDWHTLKRYAVDFYSEAATRLTNLLQAPQPVSIQDRFLEDGLIHRTLRGESVRSKSEVIIANMLFEKGIQYDYELRFVGSDGRARYPDFTIQDAEAGRTIYWEHLGLLYTPVYQQRWRSKLEWYRQQGVLPLDQGGGPVGTLVTSQDDEHGGIDSVSIAKLISQVL